MRYSRQEKLEFIPEGFQEKIRDRRIVLVGCGGIGSVLGELLVRGGFLNLVLIDNDLIDETNLQRQNFGENDLGEVKSVSLAKRLKEIDSKCLVDVCCELVDSDNIVEICGDSDLIIDCTDNFETRKIINDYCGQIEKNWLYTGAVRTEFVCCLFYSKDKKFEKVFGKQPKNEAACDVGVLASTTFAAASLAYNQVLKYFLGIKDERMVKIDLWKNKLFEVKV